MRIGSLLLVVWLVIGAIAAGQRNYYSGSSANCAKAAWVGTNATTTPVRAGTMRQRKARANRQGISAPVE